MIEVESGFKKMSVFAVEQATSIWRAAKMRGGDGNYSTDAEIPTGIDGLQSAIGNEFPDEVATPRKKQDVGRGRERLNGLLMEASKNPKPQ